MSVSLAYSGSSPGHSRLHFVQNCDPKLGKIVPQNCLPQNENTPQNGSPNEDTNKNTKTNVLTGTL